MALVSDAGTLLISDPGYHLVTRCREAGVKVVPLPGPSRCHHGAVRRRAAHRPLCLRGFLPAKAKGRDDRLQAVIEDTRSLVFYESPRRVQDTVEAIARILGERQVVVCRELTKTFESIHGLPASEMLAWLGGTITVAAGDRAGGRRCQQGG